MVKQVKIHKFKGMTKAKYKKLIYTGCKLLAQVSNGKTKTFYRETFGQRYKFCVFSTAAYGGSAANVFFP